MPLTDDQHKPKPAEYTPFKTTILVKPDGSIDVLYEIQGSLEVTVHADDINKKSQRTGGDEHHTEGVSSGVQDGKGVEAEQGAQDFGFGGPFKPPTGRPDKSLDSDRDGIPDHKDPTPHGGRGSK